MLVQIRLEKEDAPLGIDSAGQQTGHHQPCILLQPGRIMSHGDGVKVHHAKYALIVRVILQLCPKFYGTKIVAQMNGTGGLDS